MKKMTLLSLGIISFSALTLGAPAAFADTTTPEAESEATVLFEADDDTDTKPPVVPPTDGGDKEGEIDEKETDGNTGDGSASFNIAAVSNFRFNDRADDDGEDGFNFTKFKPIKLNGNGMTLWAKGTQLGVKLKGDGDTTIYKNIPNFVQVVDNRGKLSGWNLSVTATPFTGENKSGQDVALNGAVLSVNDLSLKGPAEVAAPTILNNSVNINESSSTLMSAAANAGTGSWSLKFGEEETTTETYGTLVQDTGVKLDIPAKAQPQADVAYKATLTWVLADGPVSE